jgi:hypothetical protein
LLRNDRRHERLERIGVLRVGKTARPVFAYQFPQHRITARQ